MCDQIHGLHTAVIDAVNEMSSREVGVTPTERGTILAEGLDTIIGLVNDADLPTEPESFVAGLEQRRQDAVANAEIEANQFKTGWKVVEQEDRQRTVNQIFLIGERLMSETEPTVGDATSATLIAHAQANEQCQSVIQLPPPG